MVTYRRWRQRLGRYAAVTLSRAQLFAQRLPVAPLDAASTLDSLGWADRQPDWFPAVPCLPQAQEAHQAKECGDHNRRSLLRGRCSKELPVGKDRMQLATHSSRSVWE